MTVSFLWDRMLIKTDDGTVNSLIAMFLWTGSANLSCFLLKTKVNHTKRAFKREIRRAIITPKKDYKSVHKRNCFSQANLKRGGGDKTTGTHTDSVWWRWRNRWALVEGTQRFLAQAHSRAQTHRTPRHKAMASDFNPVSSFDRW